MSRIDWLKAPSGLACAVKRTQYQPKSVSLCLLKRSVLKKLPIFLQFFIIYLKIKFQRNVEYRIIVTGKLGESRVMIQAFLLVFT